MFKDLSFENNSSAVFGDPHTASEEHERIQKGYSKKQYESFFLIVSTKAITSGSMQNNKYYRF